MMKISVSIKPKIMTRSYITQADNLINAIGYILRIIVYYIQQMA